MGCWPQPPLHQFRGKRGEETSGLVALGRAGVGEALGQGQFTGMLGLPQSGIALITPFVSRGLLDGVDACQMLGAPLP